MRSLALVARVTCVEPNAVALEPAVAQHADKVPAPPDPTHPCLDPRKDHHTPSSPLKREDLRRPPSDRCRPPHARQSGRLLRVVAMSWSA